MRRIAAIVIVGLLAPACSTAQRDAVREQREDGGDVGRSAQFLSTCNESCPEPMSCECGVCTVTCTGDDACEQYAGNATCVLPPSASECPDQRSCDVPCTHDGICERLGDDFVCIVGRCRHEPADAGTQGDAGVQDAGPLEACAPRATIAGLCLLAIEGAAGFNNEDPLLQGTITAIGEAEARPECFGSDNNGAAIPVAAHAGEDPVVPEGTSWWRFDDGTAVYALGIAAPGLDALGVSEGDTVSIRHGVSWGGWDWPHGNAEIEIAGRGKVLIAINDSSLLDVSDGPAQCERPGPCGGQEWSMQIAVDGEVVNVPPFESVRLGSSLFTNAGAFTHSRDYMEPDETSEGTTDCKDEPRSNFVATRVDQL